MQEIRGLENMFGRENLHCRDIIQYVKMTNEIMDKMEARIEKLEDIIKVDDAIRITSLENENEHLKERNRELEALAAKHECGPCKHCTSIPGQEALAKDEYNTLYLDNDILRFSSREGEDDYVLETRISFCPICGMELEHED